MEKKINNKIKNKKGKKKRNQPIAGQKYRLKKFKC